MKRYAAYGPSALVVISFVASRASVYAWGLRFEGEEWKAFWHFIDPVLLENHFGQSLWYLHSQPPLFNAWLGVYQLLFGGSMTTAFAVTYLALGALIAREIYTLGRSASLNPWAASALASVLVSSPAALLFENFLFYTYPEAYLLLLSTRLGLRAISRPSTLSFVAFSSALSALALLRALFHPAWLLLMLLIVLALAGREHARQLAKGAAIPLLLVGLVVAKNAVLFASPSLSSWRGMNLARVVIDRMPKGLRAEWVRKGVLSPVAGVGAFKPLSEYASVLPRSRLTGVPLLDQPQKSNGQVNLHHIAYLSISRQLEQDALVVIQRRPAIYTRSVLWNLRSTFEPSWEYRALKENLSFVRSYADGWNNVFGLSWFGKKGHTSGWLVIVPGLLVWAVSWLWRQRKARNIRWVAVALCVLNTSYVIGVGALLERSENQRFRFDVDPMIGLLLCLLLTDLIGVAAKQWALRRPKSSV